MKLLYTLVKYIFHYINILYRNLSALLLGFALGLFFGYLYFSVFTYDRFNYDPRKGLPPELSPYKSWLRKQNIKLSPLTPDELSFSKDNRHKGSTEADFLFKNVSVMCVVFVRRMSNAYAVANSWGRKCNSLHFFSETKDDYLNVTTFNFMSSWRFLCQTIRHVWTEYRKDIQWVLFAYDNLYVIPENLRHLVAMKDFNDKYYLGHNSAFWKQIYNSADAGYVLSRGSIKALMKRFNTQETCETSRVFMKKDDYYLGKYLSELRIHAEDSRDEFGRERFHLFTPAQLMAPGSVEVLLKYSKKSIHQIIQGMNCCSSTSVSFQGTGEDLIYLYSYLLYNVKVFNSGHLGNKPASIAYQRSDEIWQKFIRDEFGDIDMTQVSPKVYYDLWTLKAESPEEFNRKIREQALGINMTLVQHNI